MRISLYFLLLCMALCNCKPSPADESAEAPPPGGMPPQMIQMAGLDQERGLRFASEQTTDGFVLFSSLTGNEIYLINKEGLVVHQWNSPHAAAAHYLTVEGHLIINARDPDAPKFSGGGMAGRIYEYDWDGNLLWEFKLANDQFLQHHDIALMPNGNFLLIVWHEKTPEEARQAGRRPHTIPRAGLWPDKIIEIRPVYPEGGEIVWEWDTWDHLVQEDYPDLPNYGRVADHPRKIHVNTRDSLREMTQEELEKDMARGMLAANATVNNRGSDMFHSNAIAYNETLDQIVLSTPELSEIWIIDHSITTEEARTEKGDLLYRWGNPEVYHRGDSTHRRLGYQHDVRWIPEEYPNGGKISIFNNTARKENKEFSQVVILDPPMNADGTYVIPDSGPFQPADAFWTYDADGVNDVFAPFISSAYPMKNGNVLVNFGPQGKLIEVTPEGDVVWEYWSPYMGDATITDGSPPQPIGPFKYAVFRATHVPANHPALEGVVLEPLAEQPPVQKFELNP